MKDSKIPGHKEILQHFEARDPRMAEVIREYGPMKLVQNRKYFIVLCKAIIGQQISTQAAATISSRFFKLFDEQPPSPAVCETLPEQELRSVGLSRQKVAYLKDLSRHFLEKSVRPHKFRFMSNQEVVENLTAIYGIGQWTAEMFLIFSLNRPDVLPIQDLGFQAGVRKIYRMKKNPDAKKLRALGKKWQPLETVATWYAWRIQDETIITY
jgi:DNA-3-methyladenine glycosylase II